MAELRGPGALLVRVAPLEQARQIVTQLTGVSGVEETDGALRVSIDPNRAAEVNRELVSAGLAVSELRPIQHSLEEVFLALTDAVAADVR